MIILISTVYPSLQLHPYIELVQSMGWKRMVPSRQLEMSPSGQLARPVMTGATVCRALFSTSLKKLYPAA
jgi:hypothetical protein